jgi:hypothetical protein
MKQRLIVMNGYRIFQNQYAGDWKTEKVDKAGDIKPGIYNLYLATPAEKNKAHKGVVLYVDKEFIYQIAGKTCVRHHRVDLSMVPKDRTHTTIRYKSEQLPETTSLTKSSR